MSFESFALTLRLLAEALRDRFGHGRAGIDRVHIDSIRTKRIGQRLGKRDAGNIARRCTDPGARRAPRTAAQVDDATPTDLLHVRRSGARAAIVAQELFFEVLDDLRVADRLHTVRNRAADT